MTIRIYNSETLCNLKWHRPVHQTIVYFSFPTPQLSVTTKREKIILIKVKSRDVLLICYWYVWVFI